VSISVMQATVICNRCPNRTRNLFWIAMIVLRCKLFLM